MAEISAQAVKALRDKTGAGMMDCKRTLSDAGGDVEKAIELLRERGLARAAKRVGRATSEGTIAIGLDRATGGLVELGCETDFVARTDEFGRLANELVRRVASDASLDSADALLGAAVDGKTARDRIADAVATLGENIELKRVARLATEGAGRVGGYVHAGGKLGVLVAVRTEGAGDGVGQLAKDLAMHVAAADPTPLAIDRDGLAADLLDKERAIYRKQAQQSGKPEKVIDRIVDGKLAKFYRDVCLLDQPFVKDPDQSVGQWLREASRQLGADLAVARFVRFRLGESSEA